MNTAELLVKCLENEGVKVVFGIPGEENLAVMRLVAPGPSVARQTPARPVSRP